MKAWLNCTVPIRSYCSSQTWTDLSWTSIPPQYFNSSFKKRLPVKGARNILITSALPYVNNVPHLGNIVSSVLSADVFSRYCQAKGYQSLFICGTDEYGTATEMKALKDGVSVQEICDKFHVVHKKIYDWFSIDFDYFGRTATHHQTEICQDIFNKVHANKFTSMATLEQLNCETCDRFLADRFVSGTCPYCNFANARGDQCEGCGKLLEAIELVDPKCHICQSTPTVKESKHIFLDTERLSGEVEQYVDAVTSGNYCHWSKNAKDTAKSLLKTGLKKLCITRDLKWGTPVPLEEFASKVFYVWFDAPIGYLSITKALLENDWVKWWKNPDEVELYQFMGIDNTTFHAITFPATLLATREVYTKVKHLCATNHLNHEGDKFSKSRNIGIFGDAVMALGISSDVWRYYLIRQRPETSASSFMWNDFAAVAKELLGNFGNFVHRSLKFLYENFNGVQPDIKITEIDQQLIAKINIELIKFIQNMEQVKLHDALMGLMAVSRLGNVYLNANRPWLAIKGSPQERERAGTVLGVCSNICLLLSSMSYPFMPVTSKMIIEQCNLKEAIRLPSVFTQLIEPGHKLSKPSILFAKLDKATIEECKVRFGTISIEKREAKRILKETKKAERAKKVLIKEMTAERYK